MTKKDIYEVGLKLFGIYFIANSIHSIGLLGIQLVHQIPAFSGSSIPLGFFKTIVMGVLHPGLQLAVGIFLIKKHQWIINKLDNNSEPEVGADLT